MLTKEKRYKNFCYRLFLAKMRLFVLGNVHNVSSTRVAQFDFLTENLDNLLTHFDSHLSAIFITLRPNCDISM